MKANAIKTTGLAAMLAFGTVAVGCAGSNSMESTKAMANDAQQQAQQAQQQAQQANETAMQAKRMASDAQSTANQALSVAQHNSERMNRMFRKNQRK